MEATQNQVQAGMPRGYQRLGPECLTTTRERLAVKNGKGISRVSLYGMFNYICPGLGSTIWTGRHTAVAPACTRHAPRFLIM